ncbi:MAG: molybdenum ABC transporter ATP-binding protein [Burkholderiales bacterium]|nr:molybdenum ABC transporter ATP-binding protein [Burkholderiales bacterium]
MLRVSAQTRLGRFALDVELESAGGVTALFGRSGSGKTSIINVIAGLLRPARGRVELNGALLFDSARGIDLPVERRRIGYVFQDARLFPHLSVRQNLRYGAFFNRGAHAAPDAAQVIRLLGLEALLERRPGALSGGEKQRVAIGRALLAAPRLLLMDEPLASLDAHRKGEILGYVERLRDELAIPIVYVSHAIEEVVRIADRVALVSEGRVIAAGAPDEIMSRLDLRPATGRYEAGAVIETRVLAYDAADDVTTLGFRGGELLATNLDALIGEPVRVRVRARDVSLALRRPEQTSILNVLAGRIVEIAEGPGAAAEVRLAVGEATLLARVTRRSRERLGLRPGLEVYALVKAVSLDRHSTGFA